MFVELLLYCAHEEAKMSGIITSEILEISDEALVGIEKLFCPYPDIVPANRSG
jgi:hypothetical protein